MKLTLKSQFILFLALFSLYLSLKDQETASLITTLIAVLSAISIESFILYLKDKKFTVTASSAISGLIIGYVLSSDEAWWIFVLASLFAIGSKYLIKINQKHLFNPAAFGVFLSTIFLGATTQWKGAYLWYAFLPFGLYFIIKIRKLELLLGYGLTALILFGIQAAIQRTPILNIFGYLNYFYIFIMLIEPKTTPIKPLAKIIFGAGAAILIFISTEIGVKFDAELCSLLIFNSLIPALDRLAGKKGGRL